MNVFDYELLARHHWLVLVVKLSKCIKLTFINLKNFSFTFPQEFLKENCNGIHLERHEAFVFSLQPSVLFEFYQCY